MARVTEDSEWEAEIEGGDGAGGEDGRLAIAIEIWASLLLSFYRVSTLD